MMAAFNGHLDTVKCLTEAGADINPTNNKAMTALMMAAGKGHYRVCQHLVHAILLDDVVFLDLLGVAIGACSFSKRSNQAGPEQDAVVFGRA